MHLKPEEIMVIIIATSRFCNRYRSEKLKYSFFSTGEVFQETG
jgi:hypothetical protein